ncbi:hypothetical protein D9M70_542530 [compost metagenome]
MAPTITTDALFIGLIPEDMADGDALDLVPFAFFPHLSDDDTYLPALLRYSTHTAQPIVACNDGDGIVVTGRRVECFGDPVWIAAGTVQTAGDIRLDGFSISRA